jgi:tetratricopeptide (TPR) repeat protein
MPTNAPRSRTKAAEETRSAVLRARHPGWNPERLTAFRMSLGWSRATLARRIRRIDPMTVAFTPPMAGELQVMRHERGWSYPGEDWQAAYSHVTGATRVELGFCARLSRGEPTVTAGGLPPGTPFADDGLAQLWTSQGLTTAWQEVMATVDSSMPRRQFIALSGAALAASAHEWLVADPARLASALAGRRVDAGVVADLTAATDTLRRLDDKLGGQAVFGMVTEQLRVVVGLLRNTSYSQADGQALHGIAAELARLAGWTTYDAGRHGEAQRFYLVGLRAAHEADTPGVAANILRCMAHQARSNGDPGTAIELLRSARAGSRGRLTSTEQAVLAAGLASAYGVAGDRDSALTASDAAYAAIEQARPEEDPPYLYWAGPYTIAQSVGTSLMSTGDPAGAIPHLRTAIDRIGNDLPRDRLGFVLNLAMAYTQAGDADTAIGITREAITTTTVPSSIMADRIGEVCQAITATGHPGASELVEHARGTV